MVGEPTERDMMMLMPEFLESSILAAYFLSLLILCIFGFHGYVMVYLYRKHEKSKPATPKKQPKSWPKVTIQLPIFNELYVVERLIDAACAIDSPREKLQIQVLDDSTDETLETSRQLVEKYQQLGMNIQLLHRVDRTGYKAGALREALEQAEGEFIAIFDADFIPPKDFFKKTLLSLTKNSKNSRKNTQQTNNYCNHVFCHGRFCASSVQTIRYCNIQNNYPCRKAKPDEKRGYHCKHANGS